MHRFFWSHHKRSHYSTINVKFTALQYAQLFLKHSLLYSSNPRLHSYCLFIIHHWSWQVADELSGLNELRTISMRTMNIEMPKTSNYCITRVKFVCVLSLYLARIHHIWISFKLKKPWNFLDYDATFSV